MDKERHQTAAILEAAQFARIVSSSIGPIVQHRYRTPIKIPLVIVSGNEELLFSRTIGIQPHNWYSDVQLVFSRNNNRTNQQSNYRNIEDKS